MERDICTLKIISSRTKKIALHRAIHRAAKKNMSDLCTSAHCIGEYIETPSTSAQSSTEENLKTEQKDESQAQSSVTDFTNTIWPRHPSATVALGDVSRDNNRLISMFLRQITSSSTGGVAVLQAEFVPSQFRPPQPITILKSACMINNEQSSVDGWITVHPAGEIHIGCTSDGVTGFKAGDLIGFADLQLSYGWDTAPTTQ